MSGTENPLKKIPKIYEIVAKTLKINIILCVFNYFDILAHTLSLSLLFDPKLLKKN